MGIVQEGLPRVSGRQWPDLEGSFYLHGRDGSMRPRLAAEGGLEAAALAARAGGGRSSNSESVTPPRTAAGILSQRPQLSRRFRGRVHRTRQGLQLSTGSKMLSRFYFTHDEMIDFLSSGNSSTIPAYGFFVDCYCLEDLQVPSILKTRLQDTSNLSAIFS